MSGGTTCYERDETLCEGQQRFSCEYARRTETHDPLFSFHLGLLTL